LDLRYYHSVYCCYLLLGKVRLLVMGGTPARNQYLKIKSQYPNAILFFQMGDFYETFDEDAHIIANYKSH